MWQKDPPKNCLPFYRNQIRLYKSLIASYHGVLRYPLFATLPLTNNGWFCSEDPSMSIQWLTLMALYKYCENSREISLPPNCITWHSLCHVHTELQILTMRYYDDWYERKAAPSTEPCRRFAWPSAWPRHRHGSLEHWRWAAVCCGPRAWPCLLSVTGIYWQMAEMGLNTKQTWGKIMKNI